MRWLLAVLVLAGAWVNAQTITQTFGTGANAFSIEFVTIGNPGNAQDTTGFGSVAYTYNLGKFEINRDMIEKANAEGGLGITMADMDGKYLSPTFYFPGYGGNGSNQPASGISWNEAARFVNYLNLSQGYQVAYNFTTSGANDNISLWEAGQYSGINQYRHKDAYYFIPSLDEWYKAAYGSPMGAWFKYPTGSMVAPTPVSGGTDPDTAVYGQDWTAGPAAVTNAGGLSAYGTMGQGGNIYEWMESAFDGVNDSSTENREVRNASGWGPNSDPSILEVSSRLQEVPTLENFGVGLRIASLPEPSTLSLLLAGGVVLVAGRKRKS